MFGVLAWKKQAKTILNRKSENFSNLYILYILYTGGLKDAAKNTCMPVANNMCSTKPRSAMCDNGKYDSILSFSFNGIRLSPCAMMV
jgi:hypothetical protein